jgi:Tol biopolymer transport system component
VPGRTLAFVSDRGGQTDLWLQDVETRRLWRLTDDLAAESFPVWSPEGTMLAYVVEDERARRNLWTLDLRTGLFRQLNREEPALLSNVRRAAWLRGGRVLLYDTGRPFDRRPELRAVTVEGEALASLLPDEGSVIWDWSTDGETLICAVGDPLGEPRLVATEAAPGLPLRPARDAPVGFAVELAPDGRHASFSAPPLSDDLTTWILDLATGARWPLNAEAPGRRYDHDFAWSPDGRRLAYVHSVAGVTDGQGRLNFNDGPPPGNPDVAREVGVWVIARDRDPARDAHERTQLTFGNADAAPRWSPDGRWIAFLSDAQVPSPLESNIWLVATTGTAGTNGVYHERRNLTAGGGNNWSPAWMPLPILLSDAQDRSGPGPLDGR